jgi:hypothetical protein
MKAPRRKFSASFKAKVAIEAVRGAEQPLYGREIRDSPEPEHV